MLTLRNKRASLPVLNSKMRFDLNLEKFLKGNNLENNGYSQSVCNINLNIDKSCFDCDEFKNGFIKLLERQHEKKNNECLILKNDSEKNEIIHSKRSKKLDLEVEESKKRIKLLDVELEEKKTNAKYSKTLQDIELENLKTRNQLALIQNKNEEIDKYSTVQNIETIFQQRKKIRHVICGPGLESNSDFKVLYKSDLHQKGNNIECKIQDPHVHYIVDVTNTKISLSYLLKKKIEIKFYKSNLININQMEKAIIFFKMNNVI